MHMAGTTDTPPDSTEGSSSPEHFGPARRHGWLWRACLTIAWTTTVTLFTLAALRFTYHDGNYLLACVNAFTRYVYLPVYVCVAWAMWQRRKILVLLGLVVAAGHIALVAPEFMRDSRFDAPPTDSARTLRILFANVLGNNNDPTLYLQELREIDADIVVFVEYFPWWHRKAESAPAYKAYPYTALKWQGPGGEFGVFSKLPIKNPQQFVAALRACYSFEVDLDGKPLRILALHSPRPMLDPETDYYEYWAAVKPRLLALSDPAVIVGDFNATPYSLVYKELTATHLRSAHDDRGRGWATTWPNGMSPVPPIRIDHALLTPGVECVSISEGRGVGSDHKPLILDVRLREP
jgi:endonuclease/exonuclease/phosphatase (EEP) superfamily protein YafD